MSTFTPILRVAFKYGHPNPLGILIDDPIYGSFRLPNMTESFEDDLRGYWGKLENTYDSVRRDHIVALLKYYFFDLLIEFKKKSNGILPSQIVDDIYEQVIEAYSNLTENNPSETIDLVKRHVSFSFHDSNIISETKRYMETFN